MTRANLPDTPFLGGQDLTLREKHLAHGRYPAHGSCELVGFKHHAWKDARAITDMGNVEGGAELSVNRLSVGHVRSQDSRPVPLELSSRQLGHLRLEFERGCELSLHGSPRPQK